MLLFILFSLLFLVSSEGSGINPRIIGGENADRRFPGVVWLGDRQEGLVCGGTLISPTVVLTAAHCQEGLLEYALIGRYDASNSDEEYEAIPIKHEIVNPQYNPISLEYDVMLLRLERPAKNGTSYMKINQDDALPNEEDDSILIYLGWGDTDPEGGGGVSDVLQQVTVEFVPNNECEKIKEGGYSNKGQIKDDMLCSFADDKDTCYGDSGGPVLTEDGLQMGIISWGYGCAHPVFPGVSGRTSYSWGWIRKWVCAMDRASAPSDYDCDLDATFSPVPTRAPAVPTVSPAPTEYKIRIWIEIFLDYYACEISWELQDLSTKEVVEELSAGTYYEFQDEIVEAFDLLPSREYKFTIEDTFGDGLVAGGYYQISMGESLETSELLFRGVGKFGQKQSHKFEIPDRWPLVQPSAKPSTLPSVVPSAVPSALPSAESSAKPSAEPSAVPSAELSAVPSAVPPVQPSAKPSTVPSAVPSAVPPVQPSAKPSAEPSVVPSA